MCPQSNQQGYALLLLLLGMSTATLGVGFIGSVSLSSQWQTRTQDAFQLNKERARLIHYAVDYVNLYGSGGAGPGHLPCPDTDGGLLRPGPNPPCGQQKIAHGILPDGVTREAGRIAVSESLINRSSYRVSRSLVNNPSLAINSSLWPDEEVFQSDLGYAVLTRPSGQYRTLTQAQLKKPALRWVGAWLVWQMLERPLQHCHKTPVKSSAGIGSGGDELTPLALCPRATGTEAVNDPRMFQTTEICPVLNQWCTLSNDNALNWLIGSGVEHWQETPTNNHWFIKNQWSELLVFHAHRSCLIRSVDCVLQRVPSELEYHLVPVESLNNES